MLCPEEGMPGVPNPGSSEPRLTESSDSVRKEAGKLLFIGSYPLFRMVVALTSSLVSSSLPSTACAAFLCFHTQLRAQWRSPGALPATPTHSCDLLCDYHPDLQEAQRQQRLPGVLLHCRRLYWTHLCSGHSARLRKEMLRMWSHPEVAPSLIKTRFPNRNVISTFLSW